MSERGFVNEIVMPADGSPISIREKPKPMKVTVEHFAPDVTGLEVFLVTRYNLEKPNLAAKDIKSLSSIAANVFTLSSIWLASSDDPKVGVYRVVCVVGSSADKEEFNLVVKVVA